MSAQGPDLAALAAEIRAVNASKGWGANFDPFTNADTIPAYLALIHTEVTESAQAESAESALRELADVIVRGLDLMALCSPSGIPDLYGTLRLDDLTFSGPDDPRRLTTESAREQLRQRIDQATETWRRTGTDLDKETGARKALEAVAETVALVVVYAARMILARGESPTRLVTEVVYANRQRPWRHGGLRT